MKTEISIIIDFTEINSLELLSIQNNLAFTGIGYDLILIHPPLKAETSFNKAKYINSGDNKVIDLNEALKAVETRFVCYLPKSIHLDSGWLYDLYYYMTTIDNSGFISICSTMKKGYHFPLLNNSDNLISCYKPDYISDLFFTNFDTIKLIGAFLPTLDISSAIAYYSMKVKNKGLHIYNIPFQTALNVNDTNLILYKQLNQKAQIDNKIEPLFKRNEKQERAFMLLSNLSLALNSKSVIFEHPSMANYGFYIEKLIKADLNLITDYIQTFDLTFIISSDEKSNIKVTFFN